MWDFPVILTQGGPDMKRKRYTEEQIISILKEHEAGVPTEVCRKHNSSPASFYKYKAKFGGMDVSDAREPRQVTATTQPLPPASNRQRALRLVSEAIKYSWREWRPGRRSVSVLRRSNSATKVQSGGTIR